MVPAGTGGYRRVPPVTGDARQYRTVLASKKQYSSARAVRDGKNILRQSTCSDIIYSMIRRSSATINWIPVFSVGTDDICGTPIVAHARLLTICAIAVSVDHRQPPTITRAENLTVVS
jgi:hypothetical protein